MALKIRKQIVNNLIFVEYQHIGNKNTDIAD